MRLCLHFFFFKQKTAYEMRISDWSSDVCSSDLRSRTNPQYNLDVLPTTLAEYQINHTYIAELGGRRPRQRSIDPQLNGFWQNQSFHNYADYALSSDFQPGFRRLLELSQRKKCAIMCSEAVWWRCHSSEEHTSELQSLIRNSND